MTRGTSNLERKNVVSKKTKLTEEEQAERNKAVWSKNLEKARKKYELLRTKFPGKYPTPEQVRAAKENIEIARKELEKLSKEKIIIETPDLGLPKEITALAERKKSHVNYGFIVQHSKYTYEDIVNMADNYRFTWDENIKKVIAVKKGEPLYLRGKIDVDGSGLTHPQEIDSVLKQLKKDYDVGLLKIPDKEPLGINSRSMMLRQGLANRYTTWLIRKALIDTRMKMESEAKKKNPSLSESEINNLVDRTIREKKLDKNLIGLRMGAGRSEDNAPILQEKNMRQAVLKISKFREKFKYKGVTWKEFMHQVNENMKVREKPTEKQIAARKRAKKEIIPAMHEKYPPEKRKPVTAERMPGGKNGIETAWKKMQEHTPSSGKIAAEHSPVFPPGDIIVPGPEPRKKGK